MSPAVSMTPAERFPVIVGPLDPSVQGEVNFVKSSWTQSFADYRPGRMAKDAQGRERVWRADARGFWEEHSAWVDALLGQASTTCLLARANNETGLLLGWACWSRSDDVTRLHYVYVKKTFRSMGIAGMLVSRVPGEHVETTHWTPAVRHLRLSESWAWNPWAIWRM